MNQIIYAGKHLITFAVSRHSHSSWELIYCTSGSGRLNFGDYSLPYEAGSVTVIPPFTPHANESDDGFTNIHVNMLEPALTLHSPVVLRDDSSPYVLNAFSGAFYHFSAASEQQTPLLAAYGDLIVHYLLALQETPGRSKVVEEIENSIVLNYPDCNFELDEYLRSLPFNYDYIRKLFKKEIGVTPHQYLSDKRLAVAAECLCSDYACGSSVSEIAHMCGFREPLYFSRVFKNKYGVAPSQYQSSRADAPDAAALDSDSMKIPL
jgi:AraC-like DNA-binding protein